MGVCLSLYRLLLCRLCLRLQHDSQGGCSALKPAPVSSRRGSGLELWTAAVARSLQVRRQDSNTTCLHAESAL